MRQGRKAHGPPEREAAGLPNPKGEGIATKQNTQGTDVAVEGLRSGQERSVTRTRPYEADTAGNHTNGGNKASIGNTNGVNLSPPVGDTDADGGIEDGGEGKDRDAAPKGDAQQGTSDESTPGYLRGEKQGVKIGSLSGLSGKQQRTVLRYSHLLVGMLNAFFIYTPLGDVRAFELLVQIILVPVIIITGVWMWQQARVRKLLIKGCDRGSVKKGTTLASR